MYEMNTKMIEDMFYKLKRLIEDNVFAGGRVILFSTNQMAGMCIYYLRSNNIYTEGIVDNSFEKKSKIAYGVKVYNPDEYLSVFDDRIKVIIVSYFAEEMTKQLEQMGYVKNRHIFILVDDYRTKSVSIPEGYIKMDEAEKKPALLNILRKYDDICRKNGLRYTLAYGTLIGAVRHKGFIPWDDDIDVLMPIDDLKILTEICESNETDNFSVASIFSNHTDYYDLLAAGMDISYVSYYTRIPQGVGGLPIDIFPLIGVPEEEEERNKYLDELKSLEMSSYVNFNDKSTMEQLRSKCRKIVFKYPYDCSKWVTSISHAEFLIGPYNRELFEDRTECLYETELFWIPENYEDILRLNYGNFWELPPKEKRISTHEHLTFKRDV